MSGKFVWFTVVPPSLVHQTPDKVAEKWGLANTSGLAPWARCDIQDIHEDIPTGPLQIARVPAIHVSETGVSQVTRIVRHS